MRIKKGDTVKILYGKDRGRQGPVVAVNPKERKIIVEGINIYKKHVKGDGKSRESEILTIAKPLHLSKVMLICPSCNKATRVGIKRESGKVERVCKKCQKVIEMVEKKTVEEEKKSKVESKPTKKTTSKATVSKKKTEKKETKPKDKKK